MARVLLLTAERAPHFREPGLPRVGPRQLKNLGRLPSEAQHLRHGEASPVLVSELPEAPEVMGCPGLSLGDALADSRGQSRHGRAAGGHGARWPIGSGSPAGHRGYAVRGVIRAGRGQRARSAVAR